MPNNNYKRRILASVEEGKTMKKFLIMICLGFLIWSLGSAPSALAVDNKWEVGQEPGAGSRLFTIRDVLTSEAQKARLCVDASGNVGIGTTGPSNKLTVSGNADFTGNVGIGTTAPTATLEVNGRIKDKTGFVIPPGTIMAYGGTTAPAGWLICEGQSYSTTGTYADLFAVIQYSFGGSGGNFNVPDFKGRFLRGWAHGSALDPDKTARTAMATGGATGDAVGSVQTGAFEAHYHYLSGTADNGATYGGVAYNSFDHPVSGSPNYMNNTGGHETRPVNAYVNYIIKY